MRTALAVQWAMLSRSVTAKITTTLAAIVTPLVGLGVVALARSGTMSGPSAAKFEPYMEGTWASASAALLGQVLTVVMLLAAGFTVAWLFGREWADRTIGSLFSLPTPRAQLAWAKVVLTVVWAVASATFATGATTLGILIVDGEHLTVAVGTQLGKSLGAGVLMGVLGIPFGWVAVRFKGYLGALGGIIGATAVSQILAGVGVGAWVPYVAPALWAGAGGADAADTVGPLHLAWAVVFACLGTWFTVRAFSRARLD